MSGNRVRRRVEDEAAEEEPWTLENYEWDPRTCVARKKRIVASGSGEAAVATNVAFDALEHDLAGTGAGDLLHQQTALNPKLASLPQLETVDRSDTDPATVCEVVGCGASLDGLKRYYVRMRVCEKHLHAPEIVVNGVASRFCQQCAKFQFIGEFSGSKKSCTATLERHNARHRAKVLARIQEQQDGDSDSKSAPAGGRGKAGAKGPKRRSSQPDRDAAGGRSRVMSAAAAAAGANHARSDTSGFAAGDDGGPSAGGNSNSLGEMTRVVDTAAAAHAHARSYSPVAPVSAEMTAPAKPASPHLGGYGWDGASSAYAGLPPRPLVTTGGNAVVSTGERPVHGALGANGPAALQQPLPMLPHLSQQPQQQVLGIQPWVGGSSAGWQHPDHDDSGGAQGPMPPLPYDVHCALGAMQGRLLQSAQAQTQPGVAAGLGLPAGGGMYGNEYGTMLDAPQGRYDPPRAAAAAAGPTPRVHHDTLFSCGSTPGASNAPGGSASGTTGHTSQATARQALMAGGGGGAGGRVSGSRDDARHGSAGTTNSGASHSAAEPCASSGGMLPAASPACSLSEGVSVTRGGGSAFTAAGAASGGGAAVSAAANVGDMAARISSIMEELCPLIEQFKQGMAQGSGEVHESAFAAAAGVQRTGSGTQAATPGWGPHDRVGSNSLPPMVDAAMAMMQRASQLASSLQPPTSSPWTVTSGALATPYDMPSPGAAAGPAALQPAQMQVQSQLQQQNSLQQQQHALQQAAPAPGWRPLSSHPGVVVKDIGVHHQPQSLHRTAIQGAVGSSGGLPPLPQPPQPTATADHGMSTGYGFQVNPNLPGVAAPSQPVSQSALPADFPLGGDAASDGSGAGFCHGQAYGQHQPHQQHQPAGAYGHVQGQPPNTGAPAGEEDGDEEVFQQLMSFLDEPGEPFGYQQQQQQQLFQGIASAAQHAVEAHQQAVHVMPYGMHVSPFAWPVAHPAGSMPYGTVAANPPYGVGDVQSYPHGPLGGGMVAPMAAVEGGEDQDDVDPRELARVSLKAMNVLPHELPSNLRSNLRRWLKESRAEALQATLRPGCLQLVVDVQLPAPTGPDAAPLSSLLIPAHDADQAAADVFRILGQRLRDTYVQVDRKVLQMRVGERPVVLSWEEAAEDGGLSDAKYPALKGCSAAAVCAGSNAVLQLHGGPLAQPRTKAYARLRGHDLRVELLPVQPGTDGSSSSLCVSVAVPAGSVGLMVVDVGVGHLLGDWWPVLVLPCGHEGAQEEMRRLQVQEEEAATARTDAPATAAAVAATGAGPRRAALGFRRLLIELASVLEVWSDGAAADAAASIAAAASAPSADASAHASPGPTIAVGAAGARSSGGGAEALGATSPGGGSTHVSRSDVSSTMASAAGWSYASTDTLNSSHVGSTMASYITSSEAASTLPGPARAPVVPVQVVEQNAQPQAAADAAAGKATAADRQPAPMPLAPPPPPKPPIAAVRQALCRTARLLRYSIARGLPHLTALLLATANGLAPPADLQPTQQLGNPDQVCPSPDRAALLAAVGIDLQALLPLAVLSGSTATVDRMTAFAAGVVGAPLRLDLPQGPAGMSVLHLAALLPDSGAMASHLVSSQPWAAWGWLCLGWTLPDGFQGQSQGLGAPTGDKDAAFAVASATGNSDGQRKREDCAEEEEEEDDEEEVGEEEEEPLPPLPPPQLKLTPGSLSVLLGRTAPLRRAVSVLEAQPSAAASAGAGGSVAPAAAALVSAVEAWGRTGCALLSALCEQLARQRL